MAFGSDYKSPNKEVRTDTYIPVNRIADAMADLRTGDVFLVLRPSAGGNLGCDHLGMIRREETGEVSVIHSTTPRVRHEPLVVLLDRCKWISGFKFLRLRDDAQELVAKEVARLAPTVPVAPPAEVDSRIERTRAARVNAAAAASAKPAQP